MTDPTRTPDGTYVPIDCSFYDRLESHATRAQSVAVELQTERGAHTIHARIADLFSRDGAEFARLIPDDGDPVEVRLDQIVSIGGVPRPGAC